MVDEYGGVAGLVTLEDIIEEIFGEIEDEYDEGVEELWQQVAPNEFMFDGRIPLEDVNELLGTELPTEEADTIGGLIFARVGRVPSEGGGLDENGIKLTVDKLRDRRVHRVRAVFPSDKAEWSGDERKSNEE